MKTSGLGWFKSSYSSAQGDDCVEIAAAEQAIYVRDSKDVRRSPFSVGREGWSRFVGFVAEM
ncbi:DUF397 domain-containing protein [Streptomyces sp. AC602_WCS936]|uniref:DUF397 domain-containing protein n=1 Tax=Streptomyces sp. AC602_WCS936 TaxID=2823685 RepID=UPI001C276DA0|nr:DUF397 domain-containing protein [Streptomyces sp. AC602_WCS936]